jgi:hypothetical protein
MMGWSPKHDFLTEIYDESKTNLYSLNTKYTTLKNGQEGTNSDFPEK